MKYRIALIAAVVTIGSFGISSFANASSSTKTYALGHAKKCRTNFVKKTEKHKVHGKEVRYVACVWVAPKIIPVTLPAPVVVPVPAPTPTPTTVPMPTTTTTTTTIPPVLIPTPISVPPSSGGGGGGGAAPVISLGVSLDPTFTQSATNPLAVTWSFDVSATETLNGIAQPNPPPPTGVAEFFVDGALSQSVNVGGSVTGGQVETTLATYGSHTTDLVYDAGSNSATTGTESVTIEPPAITVQETWGGGTTATINVVGSSAAIIVSNPNFEGATSLDIADQLGDQCTATISTTTATCTMPVTGTPTALTISYPGGVSTISTQPVAPDGTQTVTDTWGPETVNVSGTSLVVSNQTATVTWSNWAVQSSSSGTSNPPNPINIAPSHYVHLFATTLGNVSPDSSLCNFGQSLSDQEPCGYLVFTVTGGIAGDVTMINEDSGSSDCSEVQNFVGQAEGGCDIVFNSQAVGQYQISVEYVANDPSDTDANYSDAENPIVITVNVS